ncbi:phosphatidylcholine synthase [Arcanobacterium wilhelmae]|uniref:Phosphatidylcholine synthase n=1 Tax=Arcanobacterium wilhelmae TaxID=1803177 RepID=A0ABT9NC61_9ACTO|nr:CDP-alcohol phosphatidyltransferase family protein [Arcanobacterium wilhelmae]MDP9801295.1 phosphatidylcholine synthase [Arcanobacterium wilhelmae]WFN90640.1 phosphatidylcholine synthase [Arcanobacterium wilhelmae]
MNHSFSAKAAAWGVHAFTMSGLAFACLATLALMNGELKMMWLWLGIAMIVDGVDGTMARAARVKEVIPWFDGAVVDIAVDYITWSFLPAIFMYLYLPFGYGWLAAVLMIAVVTSSMFCYANEGEKSSDNYFVGFPAAWNIVAVVLWVLSSPAWVNVFIVLLFVVLTIVPTYYTHPFRVKHMMIPNIIAVSIWTAATAGMVATYGNQPTWLLVIFWISGLWFLATGALRTITGRQ